VPRWKEGDSMTGRTRTDYIVTVLAISLASLAAPAVASASLITPSTDASVLANSLSAQPGLVTGASWPELGVANPSGAAAAGVANGFVGKLLPTTARRSRCSRPAT
jgi:hypothetical protein